MIDTNCMSWMVVFDDGTAICTPFHIEYLGRIIERAIQRQKELKRCPRPVYAYLRDCWGTQYGRVKRNWNRLGLENRWPQGRVGSNPTSSAGGSLEHSRLTC